MKILKYIIGTAILAGFVTSAAQAGTITGSKHDLSSTGATVTGGAEICIFCHTPHTGDQLTAPLWNRAAGATESGAGFTTYVSPTFDSGESGLGTDAPQPSGVSAGCLSCHDGATAFDGASLINGPTVAYTMTPNTMNTMAAELGDDLTDDHPISIDYAGLSDDVEFRIENSTTLQVADPVNGSVAQLFGAGTVECASCHNPHDPDTNAPFLRDSNANSSLCLACHIK